MADIYELSCVGPNSNEEVKLRFSKSTLQDIETRAFFDMAKASMAIEGEDVSGLDYEKLKPLIEVPDELLTTQ